MEHPASHSLVADYSLSHDLLSELTRVIGECDLLQEEFLEYHISKRLHAIRDSAVRMSKRLEEQELLEDRKVH
jgi:signal transduction histidine kinase